MKALEAQCIAAGRMKDKLKSFVVCSGIQYGNGEDVFYEHFKVMQTNLRCINSSHYLLRERGCSRTAAS